MTPIKRTTKLSSTPRSAQCVAFAEAFAKQNIGKYLHKFYRQSWQAVYALLFPSFSPYYSHFLPIFAFYFDLFFIHKTNVRNVPEITLKRLNWHAQRVGGKRGSVLLVSQIRTRELGLWWVMNTQVKWIFPMSTYRSVFHGRRRRLRRRSARGPEEVTHFDASF